MKSDLQSSIIVRNLSKSYRDNRRRRVDALIDVSFSVEQGEVFGFLGPNGAGKSTTIKILMGLVRPSIGETVLCGMSGTSPICRRSVGFLPENPSFYDFLNATEYLHFVASTFSLPPDEARVSIDFWLDRLDLSGAAKRPIRSFSKGMVQRLGLAQAIFHDPNVVILDEPMSGLDPQGRALVKELIVDLKKAGKTVFFSTHITADVEQVCDRLAILAKGRLCALSSVDDILQSGIEGYKVIVREFNIETLPTFVKIIEKSDQYTVLHVALGKLPELIETVNHNNGTIELVEPLRQDLEQYFLEVVNRNL